ncbi:MAG: V-type ATP synthase subunit E [Nitrospinota bacterium]
MSYNELINAIERDALRGRQKILEDAKAEADNIIRNAEKEIKRLRSEKIEEIKDSISRERVRAISRAKSELRILLLSARKEILSKLFIEAEERIHKLKREKSYSDILIKLIKEAVEKGREELGADELIAYVSEDDIPLLKNNLKGIQINTNQDIDEGVIVASADDKFRLVNTLKSRLERAKMNMLPLLNQVLFEDK